MSQVGPSGSSVVQFQECNMCWDCELLLRKREIHMTSARIQAGKGNNQRPAKAYPCSESEHKAAFN